MLKSCQTGLSWAGDESWIQTCSKGSVGGTPTRSTSLWGVSNRGKYVQTLPTAATTQEEMPADGMCRQLQLEAAWGGWKEPEGRREKVHELGTAQVVRKDARYGVSDYKSLPLALQLSLLFQSEKHCCCYYASW